VVDKVVKVADKVVRSWWELSDKVVSALITSSF